MDKNLKFFINIMNFPVYTYKSQIFAQSQLNFAQSHDDEMVMMVGDVAPGGGGGSSGPVVVPHISVSSSTAISSSSSIVAAAVLGIILVWRGGLCNTSALDWKCKLPLVGGRIVCRLGDMRLLDGFCSSSTQPRPRPPPPRR